MYVVKQASIAIRNLVVRNPELRKKFLDEGMHDNILLIFLVLRYNIVGVEELLTPYQQYYICGEFAYAALRDLGIQ